MADPFETPNLQGASLVRQALARAIAHELGHYLLRSSAHASDRPDAAAARPFFDMVVPGNRSLSSSLPEQIKLLLSAEQRPACWLKRLVAAARSRRPLQAAGRGSQSRGAGAQTGRASHQREADARLWTDADF